ncbi:TULIP family P47-like protein [Methylobacterium sp. JK268]
MQTFGWDTVFVIDNDRINQTLANNLQSLIPTFAVDLGSDPAVSASGRFRSWEVVEGGNDKLLFLRLTIAEGTLTIGPLGLPDHVRAMVPDLASLAQQAGAIALDGVAVVLSVFLRVLPKPDASAQVLAFFLQQVAHSAAESGTPGFVTPVTIIDPGGRLSASQRALLGAAIAEAVVRQAGQIAFAFASINLVPPGTNSWLTPVASDYAYMEKIGAPHGYLAVLSVTTARPIDRLERTIDQAAIGGGHSGSYLISDLLFLRNVVLPFLPTAYQASPADFRLDEAARTIRNVRSFETIAVKSGAITYHPVIRALAVATDGEGLVTQVEGFCDLKAGITMTFRLKARNRSRFDAATQTLAFEPDPNPQSQHSADIPWYFWFLGPIAVLITELVVKLIADSVAAQLGTLARDALSITKNPPQSVQWTGTRPLDVKAAGVNGAFYMMGSV